MVNIYFIRVFQYSFTEINKYYLRKGIKVVGIISEVYILTKTE